MDGTKREQTRRRLQRAGLEVMTRNGVAAATVGDVAQAAGVAAGTFYNYFATKDELVGALVEDLAGEVSRGAARILAAESDPAAQIALAVLALARRSADDNLFGRAFLEFAASVTSFRERVQGLIDEMIGGGSQRGRFAVDHLVAAGDAVLGLLIEMVRSQLSGRSDDHTGEASACLALRLLGLAPDQVTVATAAALQALRGERSRPSAVASSGSAIPRSVTHRPGPRPLSPTLSS